jgi:hypothetical protein
VKSKHVFAGILSLVLAVTGSTARADVIFSIENSLGFTPGTIGTVGVFISSTNPLGENFAQFNLPIDFLPTGIGLPSNITPVAGSGFITNALFGTTNNFGALGGPQDYSIAGDSATNALAPGVGALKLFDMNFNIGATVPAGSYAVSVLSTPFLQASNAAGGTLALAAPVGGSLNVVPEPNSAMLSIIGLSMIALRRRQRA